MIPTQISSMFLRKLQKLADDKNAAERQRVDSLVADQWKRLPDMKEFDYEKSSLCNGLRNLLRGLTGQPCTYRFAPQDFGRQICELMEYTDRFPYQQWEVKKSLDPNVPDEDNLEMRRYSMCVAQGNHIDKARELFMDVTLTMGKLARNIHSTILGRVVSLIVKCKCLNNMGAYNHEQADALTVEINECWWTLQTEIELMNEEDKADIFPTAPTHDDSSDDEDDDFDADQFSDDEDPDYATEQSREHAIRKYNKEHKSILKPRMPFTKNMHPMDIFDTDLSELADEMVAGNPSTDDKWNKFDYQYLSLVLAANFSLRYEDYERIEDGDDEVCCIRLKHNSCWEETKEEVLKKQIVSDLRRYLTAAAKLAQKINSSTYKNWTEMLAILENYNGEFYGWNPQTNTAAKKDLRRFIALFKPARQQIWSDVKVFLPEAHKANIDDSTKQAATTGDAQHLASHKPLTKTDVQEAFQQALGSTPIEIKDTTAKTIRGAFDDVAASIKEVANNTRPPAKSREDILALVRDIRGAKIKGVTSYPKATEYVRRIAEPSDERFYKRCAWAREFARTHAKKTKTGQDKFWASIAQDAKPSAATQRAKAKRSGVPGIVPTLHN